MHTPLFLNERQILRLHNEMIMQYGGIGGLRDINLLRSAIAMPQTCYDGKYLHADIYSMAAAYLYHIVSNHPFLDGNKRTGAAAAIIFLIMNNITLLPDDDGLVTLTLSVACGESDKSVIADFFRQQTCL